MAAFYQLSPEEVIEQLGTQPSGLDRESVDKRQRENGLNVLEEARQRSRLSIFLSQFKDVMILILFVAAVVSFIAGEHTDAFVILAIIIGNAWMGFSQEYNAEKSVRMLQRMAAQYAMVLRHDKPEKIEASQLVPGDIILLEAGDIVPADGRLIALNALKTDEASLTGESQPIEKTLDAIGEEGLVPGDQLNMVFKGTTVSNGNGKVVVTTTGMNTEIGKIAGLMETPSHKTPLQRRLTVFSRQLAVIVIVICLAVFGFGLWRGEPAFSMFLTALSLAVAALPEALPAVITIALARGARRMVKQQALIKKLPAVETLGSVTYICSDKTGTLTQNVMTVEKVEAAEGKTELLHHAMLLNNEVRFSKDGKLMGDSTETALIKYAFDQGLKKEAADRVFPMTDKLPFDSERMRMSTLHRHEGKWILFVKGAPGKMTEVMRLDKSGAEKKLEINRQWASEGLRVLFFGYRVFDTEPSDLSQDGENDLEYLGMTAMIDPPREEVIDAIAQCRTAGIKTVMITGDQPLTASAIAERLGMAEKGSGAVVTGTDLGKQDEAAFGETTKKTAVYARVSPEQKLNIVKSLQSHGEFVAMTGDGVNDAPSLKQADIGVAMGITGTDVTKEAASMILLDDNFATIVKAIREGRRIYENIRKFIVYVLSCNLGEILTIFSAPLFGFAIPLLPIHILWINLVTDGLPGLMLVAEPEEKDIMKRPPRPPGENLFAGGLIQRIMFTGIIMAAAALFVQWWMSERGYDIRTQQTAVFTTLCFVQLGNALSVRSMFRSMFSRLFSNPGLWAAIAFTVVLQSLLVYTPFLQPVFKTTALNWSIVMLILVVTVVCVLLIELLKLLPKRK